MLIDDWVHTTEAGAAKSKYSDAERTRTTLEAMHRAQNFVMSPLVIETASSLGRDTLAIERSAGHLFLPAETTWLDLTAERPAGGIEGSRQGVLMIGRDGSTQAGEALYIAYLRRAPPGMPDNGMGGFLQVGFTFDLTNGDIARPVYGPQHDLFRKAGGNIKTLASTIWATVALMNTRRIADIRDADLGKINRARHKARRPPILQYKIVTISIDRSTVHPSRSALTGEMPLHHVRTHLRIKRGKVEMVRPHWRGNPRFGVIIHRYVALRAEDTPGPWQGGPLPANKIIKETER